MFVDKLVEFLLSVVHLVLPWRIVEEWESGVVLRFGKFQREAKPGRIWVIPLAVERLVTCDTYERTSPLPAQSLTTSDGVGVVVSAVVTHRVVNSKRVLLECGDAEEALIESLTGTIAVLVLSTKFSDLTSDELWRTIRSDANRKAKKWGVKIVAVQPRDIVRCRSLRLFSDSPSPAK